jgi:hypothetical protein
MVVRHNPRNAVDAPIAEAPPLVLADVDAKLRELLDRANALLGRRLSPHTLKLLKRAASVIAHEMLQARPITTVEALRARIAPATKEQPDPEAVPQTAIGHDTVRELLSDAVADVVDLAIRLGWFHGDFLQPSAMTVFATWAQAGRDSHALAAQGGMLPLIGTGVGSFDSFVINNILELVKGTHHDPLAPSHAPDAIRAIVTLWGFKKASEMALLDFERTFELLIAHDAQQRDRFIKAASKEELARAFPQDIVVQRLPHGPYLKRYRTPKGEIMAKDYTAMADIVERYDYRAVLTYSEDLIDSAELRTELARVSELNNVRVRQVDEAELQSFQNKRSITVDVWDVEHYVLTGFDATGTQKRRVARHARFDHRVTVFETVGFDNDNVHEAVVLAEYGTANELRQSCINATLNNRVRPGMLSASNPEIRAGMRRLGLLASATTVALSRRAQASA